MKTLCQSTNISRYPPGSIYFQGIAGHTDNSSVDENFKLCMHFEDKFLQNSRIFYAGFKIEYN